jgi:hypothetical protein
MAEKPQESVFQKISRNKPVNILLKQVKIARQWFRDQAMAITKVQPNQMFKGTSKKLVGHINYDSIGSMYFYNYDPKTKDKLPYYDMYPMIFVLDVYPDGWLGINLHYLPPYYRAKLMDALYSITMIQDEKQQLAASYQLLKGASRFKYFRPCLKRYLVGHVKSKILYIEPKEWDMALMLPLQKFVKSSEENVWADSARKW